jgi:hypothetical protein
LTKIFNPYSAAFVFVVGIATGLWWMSYRQLSPRTLAFDPPHFSAVHPWILPESSRKFSVTLFNLSGQEATVDELRSSCECATVMFADRTEFPCHIPPKGSATVDVTVHSQNQTNREMELRFAAIGHIGEQAFSVAGSSSLRFVQHLNATPFFFSFGQLKSSGKEQTAVVDLWCPGDLPLLHDQITVAADDPCLTMQLEQYESPQKTLDGGNERLTCARLSISLDPKIAPPRLKSYVSVQSGVHKIKIPVTAFIDFDTEKVLTQ